MSFTSDGTPPASTTAQQFVELPVRLLSDPTAAACTAGLLSVSISHKWGMLTAEGVAHRESQNLGEAMRLQLLLQG